MTEIITNAEERKKTSLIKEATPLPGVYIIHGPKFPDNRGEFRVLWHRELKFSKFRKPFTQENLSINKKGVLRGLHMQKEPYQQGKYVRVIKGKVLDVVVCIRKNSHLFGKYIAVELSGDENKAIWIPKGYAHGFLSLEDNTIFSYKVAGEWNKEAECGARWNDPLLMIYWNLEKYGLKKEDLIISDKDNAFPFIIPKNKEAEGYTSKY